MKSFAFWVIGLLICAAAEAGSVKPVRGIDVIVEKHPGNTAARMVTTDGDGVFSLGGLEAGSYTLTFNPCPRTNAKTGNSSKSNAVTRFVIDNPGTKSIAVELAHITCAISEEMPLRGTRTPQGSLDSTGVLPAEVFAAGVGIEVQIGAEGVVSGRILGEN